MFPKAGRIEIDHHTIKLIIGLIALSLGLTTAFLAGSPAIGSISASYHAGSSARDVFVGSLIAVFAFLLAYNGRSFPEMVLSKVAAFAALGVALFPCKCEGQSPCDARSCAEGSSLHGISAAVMFVVLAVFCLLFFRRAYAKGYPQARFRAYVYAGCGLTIVLSIAAIALHNLLGGSILSKIDRLTFWAEAAALFAFGVAWLLASRILPLVTRRDERLSLSPFAGQEAASSAPAE